KSTLNKVNLSTPNPFREDGLCIDRAGRGAFLRRQGFYVRRVCRGPARMGAHASPLDPSGGSRVDALPRSEFAHDRAPRRGDASTIEDLLRLERTRGVHPCGEGGEFETLVLDGPLFHQRVEIRRAGPEWSGTAGVWRVLDAHLVPKSGSITAAGPAGPSGGP